MVDFWATRGDWLPSWVAGGATLAVDYVRAWQRTDAAALAVQRVWPPMWGLAPLFYAERGATPTPTPLPAPSQGGSPTPTPPPGPIAASGSASASASGSPRPAGGARCGDGMCDVGGGETCATCAVDCGFCPSPTPYVSPGPTRSPTASPDAPATRWCAASLNLTVAVQGDCAGVTLRRLIEAALAGSGGVRLRAGDAEEARVALALLPGD